MRTEKGNEIHSSCKTFLSIISPVYKGEEQVRTLVDTIEHELNAAGIDHEIILVEDGSPDKSWLEIKNVAAMNKNVKGIRLSRNFGQHNAIHAGLEAARGDWISVIDCDLQDNPKYIAPMLQIGLAGNEVVIAKRDNRKDGRRKVLLSKVFNRIFSRLLDFDVIEGAGNFGVYSKVVIDSIKESNEVVKYFPGMIGWAGFDPVVYVVEHEERISGKSGYSLKRLVRLGVNSIIGFSDKPLRMVAVAGFSVAAVAAIGTMVYLALYLWGAVKIKGFTTLVISIWLTFGINMLISGALGLYLGQALEGTKNKKGYIIREMV